MSSENGGNDIGTSSGSGDSSSPISVSPVPPLHFNKCNPEDESLSSSLSPDRASESLSSTPASTPTPTPVNGKKSPTDRESIASADSDNQSGGNLKFYKDGVLCLELSHNDDGNSESCPWIQIRTKTVFPNVIYVKKEVTIPCHVSLNSTSGDGASVLRHRRWKQEVPEKGISSSLQFYMAPAPCLAKCRMQVGIKTRSGRRPHCTFLLANKHACTCDKETKKSQHKSPKKHQEQLSKSGERNKKKLSIEEQVTRLLTIYASQERRSQPKLPLRNHRDVPRGHFVQNKKDFKLSCDIRRTTKKKTVENVKKKSTILSVPVPDKSLTTKGAGSSSKSLNSASGSQRNSSSILKSNHVKRKNHLGEDVWHLREATDQEKYQETMCKAISYTINSLLGSDTEGSESQAIKNLSTKTKVVTALGSMTVPYCETSQKRDKKPSPRHAASSSIFGVPEQDGNSFLRHLLDTSDPIPTEKILKPSAINQSTKGSSSSSSSSSCGSTSNHVSSDQTKTSPTAKVARGSSDIRKKQHGEIANAGSKQFSPAQNHSHPHTSPIPMFPPMGNPYFSNMLNFPDKLATTPLTAAAYSCVAPGFLPHLMAYPSVAAAAAAAVYGFVPPSVTNMSPPSDIPGIPSPSSVNSNKPLNLCRRSPDTRISDGFRLQDRHSSAMYGNGDCSPVSHRRRDESLIENDVPLNLCKKPRSS